MRFPCLWVFVYLNIFEIPERERERMTNCSGEHGTGRLGVRIHAIFKDVNVYAILMFVFLSFKLLDIVQCSPKLLQ